MFGFRAWVEAFNFIFQVCLDDFLSERAQSQEDEAVRRLFRSWEYVESIGKEDSGSYQSRANRMHLRLCEGAQSMGFGVDWTWVLLRNRLSYPWMTLSKAFSLLSLDFHI